MEKKNRFTSTIRVDICTNGNIIIHEKLPAGCWISFSGILFSINKKSEQITLTKDWENYGHNFNNAQYTIDNGFCLLSGLINALKLNRRIMFMDMHFNQPEKPSLIATLPEGVRPKERLIFNQAIHNNEVRIDILPDGRIVFVDGFNFPTYNNEWISLEGIRFSI